VTRICSCTAPHERKRIVLTGGPGAGKTAVLELVQQLTCQHVVVLPEAASLLFRGGFPRGTRIGEQAATQRAIFHVQRELEAAADAADHAAIQLCDRGTVDGAGYWPGPDTLWSALRVSREEEMARYDVVIHLRTPPATAYNHENPWRIESALEAARIDELIALAWQGHPQRIVIDSAVDFLEKARRAVAVLQAQLPQCCRDSQQGYMASV
jgi:predicted ATPase